MPRDGSGVYSVPPGTEATPNTTILSASYNAFVEDIEADANNARPVTAGGTGLTAIGSKEQVLRVNAAGSALEFSSYGPYPSGHLWGLTLSNNGSDATNDIDIAVGTARSSDDSANIDLLSALTKRGDASWAVGTGNGGMDTGSIADGKNYIWTIKRPDTGVVDALFSASASSPTMPANYSQKVLAGSFYRTGGVNKAPRSLSQDITDWVAYTPTFTGFGTAASVSVFSRRVGGMLQIRGKFTAGTTTATEARLTLGFGGTNANVISDPTLVPSIRQAGPIILDTGNPNQFWTLIESSVGYLTFGYQGTSVGGLTKQDGSAAFGSGTGISFLAEVPIAGWN